MGINIISSKRKKSADSKFTIKRITRKRGKLIITKSMNSDHLQATWKQEKGVGPEITRLQNILNVLAEEKVRLREELNILKNQNHSLKKRLAIALSNKVDAGLGYQAAAK